MITDQLKMETMIRTPIVILPSVVACLKAKSNAPLANMGVR
jgi:hypothetical protein